MNNPIAAFFTFVLAIVLMNGIMEGLGVDFVQLAVMAIIAFVMPFAVMSWLSSPDLERWTETPKNFDKLMMWVLGIPLFFAVMLWLVSDNQSGVRAQMNGVSAFICFYAYCFFMGPTLIVAADRHLNMFKPKEPPAPPKAGNHRISAPSDDPAYSYDPARFGKDARK